MGTAFTTADGYFRIRMALNNFVEYAQENLQRNPASVPIVYDSALRALDYMRHVALEPELYFSRKSTQGLWVARILEYAARHNIPKQFTDDAIAFVPSPVDIVVSKSAPAFYNMPDIKKQYEQLCNYIFDWEYDRTGKIRRDNGSSDEYILHIIAMDAKLSKIRNNRDPRPFAAAIRRLRIFGRSYQR